MKLTRLRVDQFRRFRRPFELEGLEPGLNLFTGANEAGKSTLVAAIRAAFFERHRSGTVEHLRPWDDPGASPEVEIDFELDGRACRLTKRFLGRRRCTLQVGDRAYDGAEAEDFIAGQLGFTHAQRGASKAEDWGIPGLLWVEQGGAQEVGDAVAHATDHLRGALTASLGEIAGGDGDEVTAEVEKLRNELLTPASDKPRGAWQKAQEQCAALAAALAELDAERQASRQKLTASRSCATNRRWTRRHAPGKHCAHRPMRLAKRWPRRNRCSRGWQASATHCARSMTASTCCAASSMRWPASSATPTRAMPRCATRSSSITTRWLRPALGSNANAKRSNSTTNAAVY